jgi:hypothetical protein
LFPDAAIPLPEIQRKTASLLAGKGDFDSKLQALTAFLQSGIRYVAIEIGIGGYQPHSAASFSGCVTVTVKIKPHC